MLLLLVNRKAFVLPFSWLRERQRDYESPRGARFWERAREHKAAALTRTGRRRREFRCFRWCPFFFFFDAVEATICCCASLSPLLASSHPLSGKMMGSKSLHGQKQDRATTRARAPQRKKRIIPSSSSWPFVVVIAFCHTSFLLVPGCRWSGTACPCAGPT